jgi:glycosyl transferase family 25
MLHLVHSTVEESPLFACYDRVAVVNLPTRTDRRRRIARELGALGCHKWELFEAIKRADAGPFRKVGSHGAYLSHLALLESAAERNQSILILQDDCTFLPSARSVRPSSATDIFYGGYLAYSEPNRPEVSDIIGAHCMGFSARIAPLAAAYLRRRLHEERDLPPIDGTLVQFRRESTDDVTSEFKLIAMQSSSRSDVSPGAMDKLPMVSGLIQPLRSLKTFSRKLLSA